VSGRAGVLLSSAALVVGGLLGGCIGEPEPTPFRPSPPATTTPPPAPTPTAATAPASASLRELQAVLEQYSEEMLLEGAPAVLIEAKVRHKEWSHAVGVRSLDGGVPVQLSDPVQVGGITQTMVAVSVLKLVDGGRLTLDEPITRYLPELEGLLHPPKPLSVRQLLGHTSGVPDYYAPLLESAPIRQVLSTPISPEQRLALAGTVPWHLREPGFGCSRSDYVALGLLVERLRGMPLADVLRADIVEPLGLRPTTMTGDGPAPANLVHGYTLVDGVLVDVAYSALQRGSASCGMMSTVEDINTFYAALLRGELLSPASVIEMKGRVTPTTALAWTNGMTGAPTASTMAIPAMFRVMGRSRSAVPTAVVSSRCRSPTRRRPCPRGPTPSRWR
jgi:D-alanyl-D-alanine carboxypeptidase